MNNDILNQALPAPQIIIKKPINKKRNHPLNILQAIENIKSMANIDTDIIAKIIINIRTKVLSLIINNNNTNKDNFSHVNNSNDFMVTNPVVPHRINRTIIRIMKKDMKISDIKDNHHHLLCINHNNFHDIRIGKWIEDLITIDNNNNNPLINNNNTDHIIKEEGINNFEDNLDIRQAHHHLRADILQLFNSNQLSISIPIIIIINNNNNNSNN